MKNITQLVWFNLSDNLWKTIIHDKADDKVWEEVLYSSNTLLGGNFVRVHNVTQALELELNMWVARLWKAQKVLKAAKSK